KKFAVWLLSAPRCPARSGLLAAWGNRVRGKGRLVGESAERQLETFTGADIHEQTKITRRGVVQLELAEAVINRVGDDVLAGHQHDRRFRHGAFRLLVIGQLANERGYRRPLHVLETKIHGKVAGFVRRVARDAVLGTEADRSRVSKAVVDEPRHQAR